MKNILKANTSSDGLEQQRGPRAWRQRISGRRAAAERAAAERLSAQLGKRTSPAGAVLLLKQTRRARRKTRVYLASAVVATAGIWSVGWAATGNAAWVTTGTGAAATVSGGTVQPLTIAAATSATGLVPGGSASATFKISNPNPFPVKVGSATVTAIGVSGGKDPAACTSSTIAGLAGTVDTGAVGTVIAGGATSAALGVTLTMSTASDDGCQGVVATPQVSVAAAAS